MALKCWNNETLVYLTVQDVDKLEMFCRKLRFRNIPHYLFYEPDLNNELTAIAVYDQHGYYRNLFKKLQMLGKE